MFLSEVVARFLSVYPRVEVDVRLTSALLDFVADGIDVAIRISAKRLRDSTLKVSKIGRIDLGVYASPAYIERRGVPRSPASTLDHDWVVFASTRSTLFSGSDGTEELAVRGRVSCDDMFFVHHAVPSGIGLGVLPLFLAEADVARRRITRVFPSWVATSGSLWFVTPAAKVAPGAVTAFRGFLVREAPLPGGRGEHVHAEVPGALAPARAEGVEGLGERVLLPRLRGAEDGGGDGRHMRPVRRSSSPMRRMFATPRCSEASFVCTE